MGGERVEGVLRGPNGIAQNARGEVPFWGVPAPAHPKTLAVMAGPQRSLRALAALSSASRPLVAPSLRAVCTQVAAVPCASSLHSEIPVPAHFAAGAEAAAPSPWAGAIEAGKDLWESMLEKVFGQSIWLAVPKRKVRPPRTVGLVTLLADIGAGYGRCPCVSRSLFFDPFLTHARCQCWR